MTKLTENIGSRIPLDDYRKLMEYASKQNISKSDAIRRVFNKGLLQLDSDTVDINQKILIELLMIMRSTIKDDDYQDILSKIDQFKELYKLN